MLYQAENPHGGDLYGTAIELDYSANTNPYGTPEGVKRAIQEALGEVYHYPDPYCRELVRAISDWEQVPEEWILCGNGAAELIYSYAEAVRPKRAAELAPAFSEYALGLKRVGCELDRYLLSPEREFLPDGEFLAFLEEKKPEAVFLCNPNNPTGRRLELQYLEAILMLCRKNGMLLFLDECFLDLSAENGIDYSASRFLREHPQLFILKAFTKSYGMAGVRLGYGMSSDPELLKRMAKTVPPWNVSLLAQKAGVAALREQAFLKRTRQTIQSERRRLQRGLEALGFWVCPSEANFLLFYGAEGLEEALRNKRIAIRNAANFYGLGSGWYRIAVRLPEENKRLLEAIRQIREEASGAGKKEKSLP